MNLHIAPLPNILVKQAVESALLEDLGSVGDLTSDTTIPADLQIEAHVVSRQAGCIAGLDILGVVMAALSSDVTTHIHLPDASIVKAGDHIATLSGPARAILSGERVGLNFLGHLSGIATATRTIVDLVADLSVRITCTRKTTPGLRAFEKYAVRAGGGVNHRFGLYDGILLKDNHIAAVGGDIGTAINKAKAGVGHMIKIEVEVDTLEQLEKALPHKPDVILLDNMSLKELAQAVVLTNKQAILEASGGITNATARAIAETGVDVLSLGWLTHSSPCLDLGLDIL